MVTEENGLGFVSFHGDRVLSFSVRRIEHDQAWLEVQARQGRYVAKDGERRHAILDGRAVVQVDSRAGNFGGTWDEEVFIVPVGNTTYLVGWADVDGAGHRKVTPERRALGRELAATFEPVPIQHRETFDHVNPSGRFSFRYPAEWQLVSQNGQASVQHGRDTWIDLTVWPATTFDTFQSGRFKQIEPVTEWFAHQLPGRHQWQDEHELYVFERGPDLVVLTIFRANESPETIQRFFDSLELN